MTAAERRGPAREFQQRFGAVPTVEVQVPGRVNLIGDHTDYHEGFVLPMAIDRVLVLQGRPRADRRVRVYSRVLQAGLELDLDVRERHAERWARYFQGVLSVLAARQPLPRGCDVLIEGDLPPGSGLSSSSALVVGFAALLARLAELPLSPADLAIVGRDAEHWYGTTGGIMDQFVISHARARYAVLLDCRTLHHEYVPWPADAQVVIAHSGTRHNQLRSPFAQRRQEAEAGLRVLQAQQPTLRTLRDVDPPLLEVARAALLAADPTGVLWRRCYHVVTENARVQAAAVALARGALAQVGALMSESHASLRDAYEVSCRELDALVAAAEASPGCLGARMTGGGFGGCTVNLVARDAVTAFCESVRHRYHDATGIDPPLVFAAQPSEGVRVLDLN
ncbi:MAG TPA: galactokinase [Chloroflexota bacterium]|nr:galactokinase [Chloroflexota bacterium]